MDNVTELLEPLEEQVLFQLYPLMVVMVLVLTTVMGEVLLAALRSVFRGCPVITSTVLQTKAFPVRLGTSLLGVDAQEVRGLADIVAGMFQELMARLGKSLYGMLVAKDN